MNKKEINELKGHIIGCKEGIIGIMRKSHDITQIQGLSKAIKELDKALDMI
jgi:hypothetical protein